MSDDRTAQLLTQLEAGVTELRSSDAWQAYLACQARFHRYSMGNVLLIMAQCPQASRVAGFKAWQGFGRQVRKGERALYILAPLTFTRTDTDPDTGKQVKRTGIRGFRGAAVFDVSQTDGEPLPEAVTLLDGSDDAAVFARLALLVKGWGWDLTDASDEDLRGANGDTSFEDKRVRVAFDRSPAQRAKTLAHEIGHVLMHESVNYSAERALCELEAESVAFVVCAHLGLVTDGYSFGYVASWTGDKAGALIKASGDRVAKAARKVLDEIGDES